MVIKLAVNFPPNTVMVGVPPLQKKQVLFFQMCTILYLAKCNSAVDSYRRRLAVLWHWQLGVMLLKSCSRIHRDKFLRDPINCYVRFVQTLGHSTFSFWKWQCSLFGLPFFFSPFLKLSMDCHCSFTHCSGAAWSKYNENCMCVKMWFHVFFKIDYHLYVKLKSNLLLMLIENVLPHCINPACKNIPLKAVVFSKKYCAWLSLTAFSIFLLGSSIRLFGVIEKLRAAKVSPQFLSRWICLLVEKWWEFA